MIKADILCRKLIKPSAPSTLVLGFLIFNSCALHNVFAQEKVFSEKNPADIITPAQWKTIDASVDRGLKYLSQNQNPDGSFRGPSEGQPGITSLAIMAFVSRGYTPDQGPYAPQLTRAVEYVLRFQQSNGNLTYGGRHPNYSHAISGLMLGEVYGQTSGQLAQKLKPAIEQAIQYSRSQQTLRKHHPADKGGWRYQRHRNRNESDLTVTAWQLMFYRSARNAGFNVPDQYMEEALGYIKRTFIPELKSFSYMTNPKDKDNYYVTGATSAGGIVSLAMAGEYKNPLTLKAADWILAHPFNQYNYRRSHPEDRFHYSGYYCSQAMFLLGGDYWEQFFPAYLKLISTNQNPDGSWDRERIHDGRYGNVYTTSLMVLSLTPPYQILPIYQR